MIGKTISHYKILVKIGEGGMGVVYKAEDTRLKRMVALKFLPPELTRDPEAKDRFIQEAQAASRLQHNNICSIHDIDEIPDGPLYMVMDFYEGELLKEKIARGPMSTEAVVTIAEQIACGLANAHEKGIVHRDIKPANILITVEGTVKILDFGLAKLANVQIRLTRERSTLGTLAYMSPEQVKGVEVEASSDVWSLGVVMYEMITGHLPYKSQYEQALIYSILNEEPESLENAESSVPKELVEIIYCAMQKNAKLRYESASGMVRQLQKFQLSQKEAQKGSINLLSFLQGFRRPRLVLVAGSLLITFCIFTIWFLDRQAKTHRARETLLPQIEQIVEVDRDNYYQAYTLAVEAKKYLPHDRKLADLLSAIQVEISIITEPPGAQVRVQEYKAEDDQWIYLGVTPISKAILPKGFFRFKMEKEGYEPLLGAAATYELNYLKFNILQVPNNIKRVLDKKGERPAGMVHVEGQAIAGVGLMGDFYIDQYEVTNKQFKKFVNDDGYRKREYWPQTFVKEGNSLSWEDGIKEFVDQTGRAGPAGWQAGDYLEGQAEHPVSGISWYEAAAYARYSGKRLPTFVHWRIASRGGISSSLFSRGFYALLAPRSNFNGKGTVPVGSCSGITCYGVYDMAGNVREWCWNESPMGRVIRGGAWNDATYMMSNISQASPFDRSLKNGFRCAVYPDSAKIPASAFAPVTLDEAVDFYKEKPVPDAVFQVYKEQFRYDNAGLDARVEWRKDDAQDWICEKISFSAAYNNERMMAYLFLPVNVSPPFQTIIYFPGGGAYFLRNSTELEKYWEFDVRLSYLVKNGRAVLFPIYKGTFERGDEALANADENSYLFTEFLVKQIKDFKRCIDYLETRPDIESGKIAYFGFSRGGVMGALIPAVDERIKVNIFAVGALFSAGRPEVRGINYVGHVTIPTLMLNGKYDMTCPYETNVKPMFDLLGTPLKDKRLVLYDSDHFIPRNEFIKEALNWLDRYLGRVK